MPTPRAGALAQLAPRRSRIKRVTSPPSARPLVSRITAPTSGPIALALPLAHALGGLRLGRDRSLDDRAQLVGVLDPSEALPLGDRGRVATLGDLDPQHLAAPRRARSRPPRTSPIVAAIASGSGRVPSSTASSAAVSSP